jgi:hypothetical protein
LVFLRRGDGDEVSGDSAIAAGRRVVTGCVPGVVGPGIGVLDDDQFVGVVAEIDGGGCGCADDGNPQRKAAESALLSNT